VDIPLEQITAGRVFVLERGAQIVGFYAVVPREDGDSELDALFVEPASQRQGIGRLLVEHCIEFVRAAGASALHVIGNPQVEKFYAACGFDRVGSFKTRFGPALMMRRTL
jgi:GNAT superfamily N-acetyltransferase